VLYEKVEKIVAYLMKALGLELILVSRHSAYSNLVIKSAVGIHYFYQVYCTVTFPVAVR